jgi:hypothetical protein
MSIRELLFGVKDDECPSKTQLLEKAHQYFAEHGKGLDEGKVKKKFVGVTIIISFVTDEGKT